RSFFATPAGRKLPGASSVVFFEGRARLGTLPEEYPPFPKSGKDGPLALRYIFRRERMGKLATDRRYSVCLLAKHHLHRRLTTRGLPISVKEGVPAQAGPKPCR